MTTPVRVGAYIDGRPRVGGGREVSIVDDSSTGERIAEVEHASERDVDDAVSSALRAQRAWAAVAPERRIAIVEGWAARLNAEADELAALEVAEVGTPVRSARALQVDPAVRAIGDTTRHASRALADERADWARVVQRPAGVVAAITPWNYPLFQMVLKVAPALVAGCAVVLKPSEVAPLAVMRASELATEAGLPPGVLNVVNGDGPTVGQRLVSHPDVDAISFTGSFAGGRAVALAGAQNCRPVTLELGGKSASIVLDDNMLEDAVRFTWANATQNAGQTCAALSRLIVPRRRLDDAVAMLESLLDEVVLGDAHDPATTVGPVISAVQQRQILTMLDNVERDGNRFIGPSPLLTAVPSPGWFVPPVAVVVERDAEIAQQEVFGPVLCVVPFDDDDDALAVAEASRYGLLARVWTADDARFDRFAEAMRVGGVLRNDRLADWSAPFGGVKDSGYGRERGAYGVAEFLVAKAIHD